MCTFHLLLSQIRLNFREILSVPLLFVLSTFHRSAVAFPNSANLRESLPRADWVLLAEGNQTALAADAFRQAKLADQHATQAKMERIERMMNSSLQHNKQIMKNGADALHRLAKDEEWSMPNDGNGVGMASNAIGTAEANGFAGTNRSFWRF
uniref:DUF148 domain-containing protein n=1 Tax=Globodera pallida TaxID=36090 RepID=A0A183BQM2_GLOPA